MASNGAGMVCFYEKDNIVYVLCGIESVWLYENIDESQAKTQRYYSTESEANEKAAKEVFKTRAIMLTNQLTNQLTEKTKQLTEQLRTEQLKKEKGTHVNFTQLTYKKDYYSTRYVVSPIDSKKKVGIPKGMKEDKDADTLATAIREFTEEIGIRPHEKYFIRKDDNNRVISVLSPPHKCTITYVENNRVNTKTYDMYFYRMRNTEYAEFRVAIASRAARHYGELLDVRFMPIFNISNGTLTYINNVRSEMNEMTRCALDALKQKYSAYNLVNTIAPLARVSSTGIHDDVLANLDGALPPSGANGHTIRNANVQGAAASNEHAAGESSTLNPNAQSWIPNAAVASSTLNPNAQSWIPNAAVESSTLNHNAASRTPTAIHNPFTPSSDMNGLTALSFHKIYNAASSATKPAAPKSTAAANPPLTRKNRMFLHLTGKTHSKSRRITRRRRLQRKTKSNRRR